MNYRHIYIRAPDTDVKQSYYLEGKSKWMSLRLVKFFFSFDVSGNPFTPRRVTPRFVIPPKVDITKLEPEPREFRSER